MGLGLLLGCPFRATPNHKMEAASSVQEKDKMADGSGFLFPPPLRFFLIFWFLRGKGESFQIKIMLGEQEQSCCVKLSALCYRLENRKNWSGSKSLKLDSCLKLFSLVTRPLSAFCRYRKRTRIETHFSSITLQRDDQLRLNRVEEGYSCLKTVPWQCSAYTSINYGRSALKDDWECFWHGPVRELYSTANDPETANDP